VKQPPAELAERLWQVSDPFLALSSDVKVDELAELSGVPRATLYYYFSGKDDVMSFLLAQKVERAGAVVAEAATGDGPPIERLARVCRVVLHQMAAHPALCTRLMWWMTTPTAEQLVIEAQSSLLAPVRELFAEGQAAGDFPDLDPVDATTAVMGALAMVAMRHTVNNDFNPDAVADSLIPCLLGGLGRGPTSRARAATPTGSRPARLRRGHRAG
jgi:AcrR family transcriptional regulator